ncbi:DUF1128 family protein [Macrococcus equipercicus]|uniref:DUF1128 domain-containing protein n=1 Tax=Macrococcus equipercicus TaxID=69967 RepID=A0A9Q9F100_9STAP|nr:DUF1128 family protein [Macrococcus equipercicus]KAA1037680.1 DUF1128 domain-containing protein [Macrococcus equipercicus]UTH13392.1 DUF1128 domain-containing protein [Macrococcus equipercicus]
MTKEEMLNAIAGKLKLVNIGVIKPESIDDAKTDELQELYEMVMKRDNISPSEMTAITEALGSLRK